MGEPITKEHLMNYKGWRLRVKIDEDRIREAESAAEFPSMRESDGSQHQPGARGGMPGAERLVDLKAELMPNIEENKRKMHRIEQAINSLSNPHEQSVLVARYLSGESCEQNRWAVVAKIIYGNDDEKDIKNATRLHGSALLSIAKEEF